MPSSRWTTSNTAYGSFHSGVQMSVSRTGVPFASPVGMQHSASRSSFLAASKLSLSSSRQASMISGLQSKAANPMQYSAGPGPVAAPMQHSGLFDGGIDAWFREGSGGLSMGGGDDYGDYDYPSLDKPEPPKRAVKKQARDVPSATPDIRGNRKAPDEKALKQDRMGPRVIDWKKADPSKWECKEVEYGGSYSVTPGAAPQITTMNETIMDGIARIQKEPDKFLGMFFQTEMMDWPEDQQEYNLVWRNGKGGFNVEEQPGGGFTWLYMQYQALQVVAPKCDKSTDKLSFAGSKLGKPIFPGRGQGVADVPSVNIIDDVDPNDVNQGAVGDCWLLSGMSALAEFSGAVKALFKNTPGVEDMPKNGSNTYVVTLYDLKTWQPVDITVDERLCTMPGGALLGCNPSVTGDLWASYVEKAVAIHCGGWDKIQGGTCTHAWRLLTGCKDQYTFMNLDGSGWKCYGALNPNTGELEQFANSPHDGFQGLWPMKWPEVGGGGSTQKRLNNDRMFERMCAWDDQNYIMGCGTKAGSDSEDTDGIVDGHAYTILECVNNAGGTEIDLVKVRNPWGRGEFVSGKWDDDGDGWSEYPEVYDAIQPVLGEDDGVFWVDKDEFFEYFKTIYLCAKDMTEFIESEPLEEQQLQSGLGGVAPRRSQEPQREKFSCRPQARPAPRNTMRPPSHPRGR